METVSYIKYLRISDKKLKAIAQSLVRLSPEEAINRLLFLKKKGAKLLIKILKTAESDALNNFKLNKENLRIKSIQVLKGPFFKRWQPVSRGMAHSIKKRTSHVKVILEEVKPSK